jgi:alkylation response protein AidB-like acyl-CoA dehydrogenase
MDLAFTAEQEALVGLGREILDGHTSRDRLREVEADADRFDRTLWADLARANLLGAGIDEAHGGIRGGIIEVCLLLEQAGATVAPIPLWPTLTLGALPIGRCGSPEQRTEILPRVASGDAILTAALSEPASDDPLSVATTATWEGDAWRLEGVKTSVPAAHLAERMLVPAVTGNGSAESAPGIFLLDPRAPGVEVEAQRGTGGEILGRVALDGAAVPEADVLVEPGTDPTALPWMLDVALTGLCAMQVGHAERALTITAEYTSSREQFGRPLATFQALQQRAADCYIDVEAMRWTMWQAAWRLSEDLPATDEVAIAKFWASEGGHRVLAAAQHLHGGIGVDVDYPLHRYTLRAKQVEMTLGGATSQLARLGRSMAAIA